MDAPARCFEAGAQERDRRALTIGAGDMDHRRELFLRVAECREKPLDTIKAQVDELRMERQEPREDPVAVLLGVAQRPNRRGPIAATPMPDAGAGLISKRRMRASVSRKSLRATTRSTIPCSSKYSAR